MQYIDDIHVPEFYRQAGYMAGHYIYTDECNPDSKYFRYQTVPGDAPHYRNTRHNGQWDYSYEDERQKRFRALVDAGVLSKEVANYLEFNYACRLNMFFIGGDDEVRKSLMDAVAYSKPGFNAVRKEEEYRRLELGSFDSLASWKDVEYRLISRNDVLFYDGMAPNHNLTSTLMKHAVHHIVLAGFKEGTPYEMENFTTDKFWQRQGRSEDFQSLTVWLGDVTLPDGRTISGVTDIQIYENYYNGNDKGIRWHRVNGELVEIHSTIVY